MYYFFIGPALLPVTPEAMSVNIGGNNKVVTLINDGEINIMHDPKLKEISFDILLPTGQKYPFAFYSLGGSEAPAFIKYFEILQSRKIPFPFIVVKLLPGSVIPVGYSSMNSVIEDFTQKNDAKNGLDIVVSLKLREYREYSTVLVSGSKKDKDGKTIYKKTVPRGKSFTSEVIKAINDVSSELAATAEVIGGGFGL